MSDFSIEGVVRFIGETEVVGASAFRKRVIAIDTQEQYPQTVGLQFVQNNVDKLDAVKNGDVVEIGFNVKGNEYNGKYFVTLQGWKIAVKSAIAPPPPLPPVPAAPPAPSPAPTASQSIDDIDDDLPF